jgi:predicted dehydrogenase
MIKPITVLLFGAGNRGAEAYGPYALAHPDELQFVAVAEPDPIRRARFAKVHRIPLERQFATWEEALEHPKMADAVFNCTQDQIHYASGVSALKAGYDMLLEKPICNTLKETVDLVRTAKEEGRILQICHVLRYTDYWGKVYEIVRSGRLGQLITISHRENVSSWHMAHSFVRGNWRAKEISAPMILAKCCHDFDLLDWIVGERVTRLSSVGSLMHFRAENAPPGAPLRCTDGCPVADKCPFYAPAIYIDLAPIKYALSQAHNPLYRLVGKWSLKSPRSLEQIGDFIPVVKSLTEYDGWPRSVITDEPASKDALMRALREGPYGRCVYHCDNDVVDHQIVSMQYESGITASLTMHGHSFEEGRTIRIDGSQATLLGKFSFNRTYLEVIDHRSVQREWFDFPNQIEGGGHGGGDFGLVRSFVQVMRGEETPQTGGLTSLESHLLAFAAEEARQEGKVVDMESFRDAAESAGG